MSLDQKEVITDHSDGITQHEERTSREIEKSDSSSFVYDAKAEAKLRRKIDWMIVPTVSILYLFCFIDRANIGNARLAGLEKDLGLQGNDYNALLSVFYVSYIVFEMPSTVVCKLMGPGWFIPLLTLLFGGISIATGFVNTFSQACGVRFLLGIFEAGMMPCIAYYMSRWYRRSELAFRLSLYIVMAPLAGAFGGLLASAILTLDHFGSVNRWRMIFVIEGIITVGLALIAFFTMTDRPETARWLTPEEKELALARVRSERPGQTQVLDKLDRKKWLHGVMNPITISTAIVFLMDNITVQGLAFFSPTIVRSIYPTYTTVQQQLYTVPPYIVGGFFTVLFSYISSKLDKRQIFFMLCAPMMMVGYIMFLASRNPQVRYGATFLIASTAFGLGSLSNAQVSANVVSDTARNAAISVNMLFGNMGGLISTWSFLSFDAPDYKIGNGLNLASSTTILLLSTATYFWMKASNKSRAKVDSAGVLHGLSQQEIEDLDWKHPSFRWRP